MSRFNKEILKKAARVIEAGALATGLIRGIAPDSAVQAADNRNKLRTNLMPEGGHVQQLSEAELAELRPDQQHFLFPGTHQPGAIESSGPLERLQQQENTPAVVPEFPLTESDTVALEAYFQQQYGVSIEQAVGDASYVVFDLALVPDGSLPVVFDPDSPLSRQLEVVLNAVNQVDPSHTLIGLQMNLGTQGGQRSLGFSIVYHEQVGFRTPGTQEYLGPDNQFKYLQGVRDDTEVVLFRVDPATSEQIGQLALIENGVSLPVGAPQAGTLMLLERYPDNYADEAKRGVVVSFIVGNRALVVASELPAEQASETLQVVGMPVATPQVNNITLALFSTGAETSGSGESEAAADTGEIWERYGVSEDVFHDVLSDYPGAILNRLTLPAGDPNHMIFSAEYGTVVDGEGRAWFPDMAPSGSPESESYLTLMDNFVDTENNITYNLFMNPEAYSDRRTAQVDASSARFSAMFKQHIANVDSEHLAHWRDHGIVVNVILMANWDMSMRLDVQHIVGNPTGESALGFEQNGNAFNIKLFAGMGEPGDLAYLSALLSSSLSAGIRLIEESQPNLPISTGTNYINRVSSTSVYGGWSSEVLDIVYELIDYESDTRTYTPIFELEE